MKDIIDEIVNIVFIMTLIVIISYFTLQLVLLI